MSYTIRLISIGSILGRLFAKGVWNLTHDYPFGSILENMGPSSKPFWKILKNDRFYLDPHFSAWDQKGLGPDPFGAILGKMGACAKPFQELLEIYGFIWTLIFQLGAKRVWNLTLNFPFGPMLVS